MLTKKQQHEMTGIVFMHIAGNDDGVAEALAKMLAEAKTQKQRNAIIGKAFYLEVADHPKFMN